MIEWWQLIQVGTRESLLDAVLSLTYTLPQLGGIQITEERAFELDWGDLVQYHRFQQRTRREVADAIKRGMKKR